MTGRMANYDLELFWRTPMTATELLADLAQQGVQLWVEGDRLRYRAPKGALTPSLRDGLLAHKSELLALLPPPQPETAPDPFASFPLTDLQQAYALGQGEFFELGRVAAHYYTELEVVDLDVDRLNRAWQRLVERHPMMRAVIEGEQQRVLETVPPFTATVVDLREIEPTLAQSKLLIVREAMSNHGPALDRWPLFEVVIHRLDEHTYRIHNSIALIICDAWSSAIIFQELSQFYHEPEHTAPPLDFTFREYVLAALRLKDSEGYQRSHDYWWQRLDTLPPAPELPLAKTPGTITRPTFTRRISRLDQDTWQQFKDRARTASLTPATTLAAVYNTILTTWNKNSRFTLNVLYFNRLPLHPQVFQVTGNCSATILLEVDNSAREPFSEQVRRLQHQLWNDLEHGLVGGVAVQGELNRHKGEFSRATMPVTFASAIGVGLRDGQVAARLGSTVYSGLQTPFVLLDHQVSEERDELILVWDVVEEAFPSGLIDDMWAAYLGFIQCLAHSDLPWRSPSQQLLPAYQVALQTAYNQTALPFPPTLLHELFHAQVAAQGTEAAVITTTRTLTYRELADYAIYIGQKLRTLGVQPNTLVAIVMEKGWEQIAGVLGVLEAGAAYLPIDPSLPDERRTYLMANSGVRFVLTQSALLASLEWPLNVHVIAVDALNPGLNTMPLPPAQTPSDLAYVIYTSGSTGRPKGVMIDHQGALNTILDINQRFNVQPQDRIFAISSLSFDLSVYDIFGALAAGAALVIPDAQGTRDPAHWAELLHHTGITIWNSAPPLMKMLIEYCGNRLGSLPEQLRLVLMSGDFIPVTLPDQIKALVPTIQVISLGGATEASIWSIFYPIEQVEPYWTTIPYGRPLSNQRFYVLNDQLEPCPTWVPGQLYIGGSGLALGYWHDEAKTQASFFHHPTTGERLYRTGDLGRFLPDGQIEFLGREDFQVKVRGYRIELGEIEATLIHHPQVKAVNVAALGEAEKQLVAYIVPIDREKAEALPVLLRAYLQRLLPEYMVPTHFLLLDQLPLNSNGKVDRNALPLPTQQQRTPPEAALAPRDALEEQLANLWQEILNVQKPGIHDNFFELGGSSISAVRLMTQIQKVFGHSLPLATLIQGATISYLATALRERHLAPRHSPLVNIQPHGKTSPFFCVHPAGGNVLCYRDLARHLGTDRPFYGLQAQGLDGKTIPSTTIEDMANHYRTAIRTAQPVGPYYIGGWSSGGVIAYEIAQQLWAEGEEVASLVLIDCPAPLSHLDLEESTLATWFIQDLEGQAEPNTTITFAGLEPTAYSAQVLAEAKRLNLVPQDAETTQIEQLLTVFKNTMRAVEAYQPRPYPGAVTLLRASDQPADAPVTLDLDWGALIRVLDVQVIMGNHYTIVREPRVTELGLALAASLSHSTVTILA